MVRKPLNLQLARLRGFLQKTQILSIGRIQVDEDNVAFIRVALNPQLRPLA